MTNRGLYRLYICMTRIQNSNRLVYMLLGFLNAYYYRTVPDRPYRLIPLLAGSLTVFLALQCVIACGLHRATTDRNSCPAVFKQQYPFNKKQGQMRRNHFFLAGIFLFSFLTYTAMSKDRAVNDTGTGYQNLPIRGDTILYTSCSSLVMAGYQGWFAAEGDGSGRGWYHLGGSYCGRFQPGCATIDFWPDMSEYSTRYKTPFRYSDGSPAYMFSPYDAETVDLHFKWMKDYGIDGVFMQRFIAEIKTEKGKKHFNRVLENALVAATKYRRAICIMYDLSGCKSDDLPLLLKDWEELQQRFFLTDSRKNPCYLHHRGRPLLAIWGVGFNDHRKYTIGDATMLVNELKKTNRGPSILLGVPYYWRSMKYDTENSPQLHELIRKADIIMPWAVGRYNYRSYPRIAPNELKEDIEWCRKNHVDYVPLVFPGFSWGNQRNDQTIYNAIPRMKGDFFWQQVAGARRAGARSLYIAMFDEIDEGTAIFKCSPEDQLPLNGDRRFVGLEQGLETDHYLWLTGQAANWFHGKKGYTDSKPVRIMVTPSSSPRNDTAGFQR